MSDQQESTDRIIDLLLSESLGGQQPPDLTEKILRRADASEWRWRCYRLAAVGVVAAAACLLLALWVWRPKDNTPNQIAYPSPKTSPELKVTGDLHKPGASVASGTQPGLLQLGNYCNIKLAADTHVDLAGTPRAEAIHLQSGVVDCDITPQVGSFQVITDVGTVEVVGTQFSVSLEPFAVTRKSLQVAAGLELRVAVTEGTVLVHRASGDTRLSAGEDLRFVDTTADEQDTHETIQAFYARLTQLNNTPGFTLSPVQKQEIQNIYQEWSQYTAKHGVWGEPGAANSALFVKRMKTVLTPEQLRQYLELQP